MNDIIIKEVGLKEVAALEARPKKFLTGGVLAGLAVAASIMGAIGVTLIDAA